MEEEDEELGRLECLYRIHIWRLTGCFRCAVTGHEGLLKRWRLVKDFSLLSYLLVYTIRWINQIQVNVDFFFDLFLFFSFLSCPHQTGEHHHDFQLAGLVLSQTQPNPTPPLPLPLPLPLLPLPVF
jgi:hypothetical protein